MRLARLLAPAGILVLGAACGSDVLEPGALTITLAGTPPELTNAATVQIAGTVTRTPAADVPIVVTATKGGQTETDSASASGGFSFTITLTANAENQIQVAATDGSGSTGTPVTVTVRHDGQAPRVTSTTPANLADGVTPASITVVFDEALVPGTGSIVVTQQGAVVTGTLALSADSLTLSFSPSLPFVQNSIHAVTISGAQDRVGNASPVPTSQCFVTGGSGIAAFSDPASDFYQTAAPAAGLVPPDVLQIRIVRVGGMVRTVVRLDAPRSLSAAALNNLFAVLDFDIDADGATGFTTFKDSVFTPDNVLPWSGTGAEYTIWIVPQDVPSDSSFVAQYTEPLNGPVTFLFVPSLCGAFVGLGVPEAALGGNVGSSRLVAYADAGFVVANAFEGFLDPAPDRDYYALALPVATAIAAPPEPTIANTMVADRRFRLSRRLPTVRR